jgi:hypothetical protein
MVPVTGGHGGELDKADAALHQPPCQQALPGVGALGLVVRVQAVELLGGLGFA